MRAALLATLLVFSTSSFSQLSSDWLGHFKGKLTSVNLEGNETEFGMELKIEEVKDSTYNFTIIYSGNGVQQERAYELYLKGPGHYLLDEKNGVIVDMSYGKDRLVSFFEIQDNFIHVSYILEKKGIRFELTSSVSTQKTGGNTSEEVEVPEVQSYKTVSFQFASLKRQK